MGVAPPGLGELKVRSGSRLWESPLISREISWDKRRASGLSEECIIGSVVAGQSETYADGHATPCIPPTWDVWSWVNMGAWCWNVHLESRPRERNAIGCEVTAWGWECRPLQLRTLGQEVWISTEAKWLYWVTRKGQCHHCSFSFNHRPLSPRAPQCSCWSGLQAPGQHLLCPLCLGGPLSPITTLALCCVMGLHILTAILILSHLDNPGTLIASFTSSYLTGLHAPAVLGTDASGWAKCRRGSKKKIGWGLAAMWLRKKCWNLSSWLYETWRDTSTDGFLTSAPDKHLNGQQMLLQFRQV